MQVCEDMVRLILKKAPSARFLLWADEIEKLFKYHCGLKKKALLDLSKILPYNCKTNDII